jgi:hypothetical protein
MTIPLHPESLEAAAKACYHRQCYSCNQDADWERETEETRQGFRDMLTRDVQSYLTALVKNGRAKTGRGFYDADMGDDWDATTGGMTPPHDFQCLIINLENEKP